MGNKQRVPMQVSPVFEVKMKKLQSDIMRKHGKNVSLRDLTEKIAKTPSFDDLEKSVIDVGNFDIKINLDRRIKC